jgi:putative tricarboxylic transport membrane protein
MAPADPGGGWDTTAREMAKVFEDEQLIPKNVEVYNVSGAGGIIGLAQLAAKRKGEANQMMVMGLVMLGAIETNQAPLDVSDTTPIAALTSEPEAIVVRAESDIRDVGDLVERMKADPSKVSFAGGSAGGTDQILLGLLAKAGGVDPKETKYIAYSGGGEANQAILSGSVSAGISGASEFEDQVDAGKMRVLAVSTEEPVQVGGKEAPTLQDAGFDVVMQNWRGVVAPPDILPAERDAMVRAMERLHAAPGWKEALERNGWDDFFKPGDEFSAFLREEDERVDGVIADLGLGAPEAERSWRGPRAWGLALLGIAIAVLIATTTIRSQEGYAATGPRFAPLLVGIFMLVLALLFLARTVIRPDVELGARARREHATTAWPPPALVLVALVAYALLLEPLGYVVATAAFFVAVARVLGSRQPVRDVIVGFGLGLVLFIAFTEFLGVDLPAGLTPIT